MEILAPISKVKDKTTDDPSKMPRLRADAPTLIRFVQNKNPDGLNPGTRAIMRRVFTTFTELYEESDEYDVKWPFKKTGWATTNSFSPLDLLGVAVLIYEHGETRSHEMLLEDIYEMRLFLRSHHKDLRLNSKCWATIWGFIQDLGTSRDGTNTIANLDASSNPIASTKSVLDSNRIHGAMSLTKNSVSSVLKHGLSIHSSTEKHNGRHNSIMGMPFERMDTASAARYEKEPSGACQPNPQNRVPMASEQGPVMVATMLENPIEVGMLKRREPMELTFITTTMRDRRQNKRLKSEQVDD
jgi:hypothetical protein